MGQRVPREYRKFMSDDGLTMFFLLAHLVQAGVDQGQHAAKPIRVKSPDGRELGMIMGVSFDDKGMVLYMMEG